MVSNVRQWLASASLSSSAANALGKILAPLADRYATQSLKTAGLVITATSGTKVPKIGAVDYYGIVQGHLVTIAAGTDMPALAGDITAAYYNVYCFFIDKASVVTSVRGTEAAAIADVKFPPFPPGKALVGFILVTYASAFVADTTSLGTATTVYFSPTGVFDPSVRL